MQQAISNSLKQHEDVEKIPEEKATPEADASNSENFTTLVKEYASEKVCGDPRSIVVSRLSIWQTAQPYFRRQSFVNAAGMLRVTFATFEGEEDAVDHGGPRREFFHLLLGAISRDSGTLISKLLWSTRIHII